MTYDISGSGFDDATSDMQLQLGGEERECVCVSYVLAGLGVIYLSLIHI